MKKIELMAPAGSYAALQAAIQAGCNSVYFGVTQLNMRARAANNFTLEDLKQISEICHQANVKSYLTLNTILYDHDVTLMKKIIDAVKESHIDSIIVADIAAIEYARSVGVNVHISTQLSISNFDTVKFWSKYADVVVLAREVDMKMMKHICEEIEKQNICGPSGNLVRVEVFGHGAMCVAVSGRCGMSLFTENSSANRGACMQNCRRPYRVIDKISGHELEIDNEYVMSPKDLCTIDFLDQLADTGIDVLKIEGRGRSADYVDTVIRCYREALDAIQSGSYTPEKISAWKTRLETVFNRGLSSGYYLGKPLGEWSASANSLATEEKILVGVVTNYFGKLGVAEAKIHSHGLSVDDNYVIIGSQTGVLRGKITELRNDAEESISTAKAGELITFPIAEKLRKNDEIYILVSRK